MTRLVKMAEHYTSYQGNAPYQHLRFAGVARDAMSVAGEVAAEFNRPVVETPGVLLGLAMSEGPTGELLRASGISADAIRERLPRLFADSPEEEAADLKLAVGFRVP